MNTAPFATSVPDGAINQSARWLKLVRVGTLLMIFSLGGCYLLISFWGVLLPVGLAALVLLASRWRKAVLMAGFFLASGLSWFAYLLMRA